MLDPMFDPPAVLAKASISSFLFSGRHRPVKSGRFPHNLGWDGMGWTETETPIETFQIFVRIDVHVALHWWCHPLEDHHSGMRPGKAIANRHSCLSLRMPVKWPNYTAEATHAFD